MRRIPIWAFSSMKGAARGRNTDDVRAMPEAGAFIVTDGKAGWEGVGGEDLLAAKLSTWCASEPFVEEGAAAAQDDMLRAVELAQARLLRLGVEEGGASLGAVRITEHWAEVIHVGDCRVYRCRKGRLLALTEDHALAVGEAHISTQSMGRADFKPGYALHHCLPGDVWLICTASLAAGLSEAEIQAALSTPIKDSLAAQRICQSLAEQVVAAQPQADCTACVVKIEPEGEGQGVVQPRGRTTYPPPPWLYAPYSPLAEIPAAHRHPGAGAQRSEAQIKALLAAVLGSDR